MGQSRIAVLALCLTLFCSSAFGADTYKKRYNTETNRGDWINATIDAANVNGLSLGGTIGSPVSGATAGSVLFAGAGGVLAQDNASFSYDPATHKLTANVIGNLTGNADTVTTNANLSGEVTSVGNTTTIADSVAVTSWNLTTPTLTTSATVTDAFTLGLGTGKALIQFDDETTDYISLMNANVGVGTTAPANTLSLYRTGSTPILQLYSDRSGWSGSPSQLMQNRILFGGVNNQGWSTPDGAGIDFSTNYPTEGSTGKLNFWAYPSTTASPNMTLMGNGNVGVGTVVPTAYIHLKAGTATASTAPLKLTQASAVVLTTPEAGAIEVNDGDLLYYTIKTGPTRKTIAFTDSNIDNGTSGTVKTGTIELGHASDTTLQRVSAGVASIEGQTIITGNKLEMPTAIGDLLYSTDGNSWSKVAMGTAGQTLKCAMDSYTKYLLHMDDAGLSDSSGTSKAVTLVGGAVRSNAQSKFGGYSCLLDGAGDALTTPDHADFDFSGGVWTVDFWIYPVALGAGDYHVFSHRTDSSNYMDLFYQSGSYLRLIVITGGSTVVDVRTPAGTAPINQWSHVEVCENGDTWKIFVNGIDVTSSGGTDTDRPGNYTGTFNVAMLNATANLNAYIDEFRVSPGIVRHSATFTVMASEYKPIPTWTTV